MKSQRSMAPEMHAGHGAERKRQGRVTWRSQLPELRDPETLVNASIFFFFFFFGHTAQLVGFQFPNQGLNPGPWQ